MRILVTGAAGMLGRELVPRLAGDVTAVDLDVDIRSRDAVTACVRTIRPQVVYHLAAWTDVDGAEAHEADAFAVNADGTANVARAAAEVGAALIVVSTDYVFDGMSSEPYSEDHAVSPVGVYGRSKAAGERAALEAHPAGTRIARTAWLYGRHGRNFVDTMRTLGAERDEVAVVADQTGSPTWTSDLVDAVQVLPQLPPGIYHTTGGGSVTWAGFAEAIFSECGLDCRVRPVTTEEFGRPAPRPASSVLAVTRPSAPRLRHWHDALRNYIEETG